MQRYRCLPEENYSDEESFSLISLREQDIEPIRLWRNAQMDVLRQNAPIAPEEQRAYFKSIVRSSFSEEMPKLILLSFLYEDRLIGYGGLTNISWANRRAEVSFLMAPEHVETPFYKKSFLHFLALLKKIAFQELHLHRLFTETFAFRKEHIAILEAFGFVFEGTMRQHHWIQGTYVDSLIHGLLSN
jgi:RimJ/RimL family protein N-acetyltransferase